MFDECWIFETHFLSKISHNVVPSTSNYTIDRCVQGEEWFNRSRHWKQIQTVSEYSIFGSLIVSHQTLSAALQAHFSRGHLHSAKARHAPHTHILQRPQRRGLVPLTRKISSRISEPWNGLSFRMEWWQLPLTTPSYARWNNQAGPMPFDSLELLRPPFSLKEKYFTKAQAENFVCHWVKKHTTSKVVKSLEKWDYAD